MVRDYFNFILKFFYSLKDQFIIDDGENFKEGIVHRLDKDTSGIIVITKNLISKNKFREILLITGKGLHSTSDKDAYISKDLGKLVKDTDLSKFIL